MVDTDKEQHMATDQVDMERAVTSTEQDQLGTELVMDTVESAAMELVDTFTEQHRLGTELVGMVIISINIFRKSIRLN